jgi:hypothetical protein
MNEDRRVGYPSNGLIMMKLKMILHRDSFRYVPDRAAPPSLKSSLRGHFVVLNT